MKTAVSEGLTIDHTPAAARAAGAATLIGLRIGVAVNDVAISTPGVFRMRGVFTLPKLTTDAPAQGALLYWDNTNLRLTTTSAGNTLAGYAFAAAINGDTTVRCAINA